MNNPFPVRTAVLRNIVLSTLLALFVTNTGAQNTLDGLGLTSATTARPAYSLRKLSSAYTGSAVQIRRSSDDAITNIDFTPAGDLDTSSLRTFVGNDTAYVSRWYDQSGNGIDAFQTTPGLQPRLMAGGRIERLRGKPALYFGSANLATAPLVLYPGGCSMVGVAKGNSATPSAFVTKTGFAAGESSNVPGPFDFTNSDGNFVIGDPQYFLSNFASFSTVSTVPGSAVRNALPASVFGFVIPGIYTSHTRYVNGVNTGNGLVLFYEDRGGPLRIGNRNDGASSGNFWTPELTLFAFGLGDTERNLVENSQIAYYDLLPCTPIVITTPPLAASVCRGSNYTFSIASTGTDVYEWLHNGVPVGGNSNSLALTNISASDTGLYSCHLSSDCHELTSVQVRLRFLETEEYPLPGVTGKASLCVGESTTLTARVAGADGLLWYADSTGGTPIFTGSVYTTPPLFASTHYYVASQLCGQGGRRRDVYVAVLPAVGIAAPGPVATPAAICGGRSALVASVDSSLGQQVYWYDAPTGGNLLGLTNSGDTFWVTPTVTTTYYAQSAPRKTTLEFNYTGGEQIFTVPAKVNRLEITAFGAAGGKNSLSNSLSGGGGLVSALMMVVPGDTLAINVGQAGGPFGGGGQGDARQAHGGGATDIRSRPGGSLYDRLLVAGGGGGGNFRLGATVRRYSGGGGGGLNGGNARNLRPDVFLTPAGTGGSQTAGGTEGGTFGFGYGGGGGGWYGGGGLPRYGGGGGSSYTDSTLFTNVGHQQGVWGGQGKLVISYTTYSACSDARLPVTVTVRTRPTVAVSASVYSCPGTAVTLTATGADNYVWQPGSLTGSSISVAPTLTTQYTVIGIDNNSDCDDTAQTTITTQFAALAADTVCIGGLTSATLQDVPPGATVSWYSAPAGGGTLLGTGSTLSSLGIGTYYPQVSLPCGAVDAQPLTIYNGTQVPVLISGDSLLCPQEKTFLIATGFGNISWGLQPLPVDASPLAARLAVGLRLLNSSYTGPILRLRRSSDNLAQIFYALGRDLDTAAISAWLGADTAFCETLFDQSGSGLDMMQQDPELQPQLIFQNVAAQRPVLRFNTQQFMLIDTAFPAPFSISVTARHTGGVRGRVLSGIRNNWLLGWNGAVQARAYFEGWVQESGYPSNNVFQVYTGTSNGTRSSLRENGTVLTRTGAGVAGPDGLQMNGWNGSEGSDCEIAELVVFGAELADTTQVLVESSAHQYMIARDRLLVTAPEFGHPRSFTATAVSTLCGTSVSTSIIMRSAAAGDPSQYGINSWNVYTWKSGGATIGATAWNEGYSGFYNAAGLSFSTTGSWPANAAPSSAAGYQGCTVDAATHSWSAKRKGFPCAYYKIDVTSHEAGQLWINGLKVWEHNATGDSHASVWAGSLGASDSVEFRATRSGSAIGSGITFSTVTPSFSYAIAHMCDGRDTLLPNINVPRGVFSATPSGLNIDTATGLINTGAVGNYTVTYTLTGCAGPTVLTAPLRISMPVGDPSVYGMNGWNVYVWNSGGTRSTVGGTWVRNYTGYYTAAGLSFNSADQWASGTPPSSAAGYQGCPVGGEQNSWSAKREGFPCGRYRIDIPRHDDGAYLSINNVLVWLEHGVNNSPTTGVWTGDLGPSDKIEFRVTQATGGSGAAIELVSLGYSVQLSYPAASVCSSTASFNASVTQSGGVFHAAPAGLAIDSLTGQITPGSSTLGTYTITYLWITPCGDSLSASAQVLVGASSGDPSVFGDNEWRVHVWNSGDGTLASNPWTTDYSGYYTSSVLDFNTNNDWADGTPPSGAANYVGCPVGAGNNSWSAKRKGFPCGYYAIDIGSHDDASQLWVNGVLVWSHEGCCDTHNGAWQGMLDADDSVEFRTTQGGGGSNGAIHFGPGTLTLYYPASTLCVTDGLLSPGVSIQGGVFSAAPAGLSISAATGIINPALSAPGTYTVTYDYNSLCTGALQATHAMTVKQPAGDPTVPGANVWNVYAWNSGDYFDQTHSWNTAYAGYTPAASTSLIPNFSFINGTTPSSNANYVGCPITGTHFSWSAMRKGFPCGRYRIGVSVQDGSAEIYVNGVLVNTYGYTGTVGSNSSWVGYLSADDVVLVRGRSIPNFGGRLRLILTNLGEDASFSYPATYGCIIAGSSDNLVPARTPGNSGVFSATPAGLSINSNSGVVNLAASLAGNYTVTYDAVTTCGTVIQTTRSLQLLEPAGNPSVFGAAEWKVYAWNAGAQSGLPWSQNYAGYYTATGLDFSTEASWHPNTSPSSASGYSGCIVNNDNHSWSARRKGFPCGYYTLSIPAHDDKVELWINGVLVFVHVDCCDAHSDVWSGPLGPADSIDFRAADAVAGSQGSLTFALHQTLTASIWTGAANSDWTNGANWCGNVPAATTEVVISADAANQPIILSGTAAMVRNLTLQPGSSLAVQGTMNLYGNLVNNGGTLDMSQGTLDLEGAARQIIPAFHAQTVHVNGGGGFSLSGNSTVSGTLAFGALGGQVLLGSSNLTVGSISGGDGNAFVVTDGSGVLKRLSLSGTQLMPVGVNTTSFTPLTITSSEGLDWSVRLQGNFSGYAAMNQSAALPRIWHITPSVTPTTGATDLVFTYPDTLWTTPSLVSVFHYSAATGWSLANSNASGLSPLLNAGLRSVALSDQRDFSPFAIGSNSSPLPVTLLYFQGQALRQRNLLQWRTASEQSNRGFHLERSHDGRSFQSIGFVASAGAAGTSSTRLDYAFADSSFSGIRQVYRLRQEDLDGHTSYSNVITLLREAPTPLMSLHPNPARANTELRITSLVAQPVVLMLLDATGRCVWKRNRNIDAGISLEVVNLEGLSAGVYGVHMYSASGLLLGVARVVKE